MTEPRYNVLIVDDDVAVRTVFGRALERDGFSTFVSDGAQSAARLLGENLMDLVLVDNHMPETGGIDLIRRIRVDRPREELPILLVSGSSHAEIELAMAVGANAFLRKPVSLDELISAARSLLGALADADDPHRPQGPAGEAAAT